MGRLAGKVAIICVSPAAISWGPKCWTVAAGRAPPVGVHSALSMVKV